MKHLLSVLLVIVVTSFCVSCKKNTATPHLNITLYNKPLDTIKMYVTGNWKLVYTDGGYAPVTIYYDSTYWQLSATRIKQTYPASKGGIFIDTTINWVWGSIGGIDSSFVIQCFDDRSYPYDYVPLEVYNDTLILHDNGADGFFYHFIKNN